MKTKKESTLLAIKRTESIKAAQQNVKTTPPKGKESVHSVFFISKDHQSLYLKEILTQKLKEDWKGFNSQITA